MLFLGEQMMDNKLLDSNGTLYLLNLLSAKVSEISRQLESISSRVTSIENDVQNIVRSVDSINQNIENLQTHAILDSDFSEGG